jgi:serine/threonine-protein kinase RsbT
VIPILREDDVVRARNVARELASSVGFVGVRRTRLVTAVSELAHNIMRHATQGEIELTSVPSAGGLAIVATDHGPGIENLDQILLGEPEGRSVAGLGLRGIKRLAERFEIQTAPGQGTTVSLFVKVL